MSFTSKSSQFSWAHALLCVLIALPLLALHAQNVPVDAPKQDVRGIAVANMDNSVKPGDDFAKYANGAWESRTEIPPDRPSVGVFSLLADLSNKRTAGLI